MRKSKAIPGNEVIGCCVCFNQRTDEDTKRVLAEHVVTEGGKVYGVCEKHLSADLPPHPKPQATRTT